MNQPLHQPGCVFCEGAGGEVLWRDDRLRVLLADEPHHPAFVRVVWNTHVREMTDLLHADRAHVLATVMQVETILRAVLQPDKINLASLGNMTPHVHWHVIARWREDLHFPASVWSAPAALDPQRSAAQVARRRFVEERLDELRARLAALAPTADRH